jgi:hypothetical protein
MKKSEKKMVVITVQKTLLVSLIALTPSLVNKANAQPNGVGPNSSAQGLNVQNLTNNMISNIAFTNNQHFNQPHTTVQVNGSQQLLKTKKVNTKHLPLANNNKRPPVKQKQKTAAPVTNIPGYTNSTGNQPLIQTQAIIQTNNESPKMEANTFINIANNLNVANQQDGIDNTQVEQKQEVSFLSNVNSSLSAVNKSDKNEKSERVSNHYSSTKAVHHKNKVQNFKAKKISYAINRKLSRLFVKNKKMKFDPVACFVWSHNKTRF